MWPVAGLEEAAGSGGGRRGEGRASRRSSTGVHLTPRGFSGRNERVGRRGTTTKRHQHRCCVGCRVRRRRQRPASSGATSLRGVKHAPHTAAAAAQAPSVLRRRRRQAPRVLRLQRLQRLQLLLLHHPLQLDLWRSGPGAAGQRLQRRRACWRWRCCRRRRRASCCRGAACTECRC